MEPPRTHRLRARDPRRGRPTLAERREHERFARAVDTGHDPEFAGELAVVEALRELGRDTEQDGTPSPSARVRIADRVWPTADRTPPEPAPHDPPVPFPGTGEPTATQQPTTQHPTTQRPTTRPERPRRTRMPVVAAGIAVLLGTGAAALLTANDAPPGDALYGLKQLGESAALGLTFDDEDRAYRHLDYASDRLGELTALASAGSLDDDAYTEGFDDFTGHTHAAVSTLTELATSTDGSGLDRLRDWAESQGVRVAALPDEARDLLWRVESRTAALGERMSCTRITSGDRDELGVLPAAGSCEAPVTATGPTTPPRERAPATGSGTGKDARDPGDRGTGGPAFEADDAARDAVTLAGGPAHDAASEPAPEPTPRWRPPEPPSAPRPAADVPAPETGPRLPDGGRDRDEPVTLGSLLNGLTGSPGVSAD